MLAIHLIRRTAPFAVYALNRPTIRSAGIPSFLMPSVLPRLYASDGFLSKAKSFFGDVIKGGAESRDKGYFQQTSNSSTQNEKAQEQTTSLVVREKTGWEQAWDGIKGRAEDTVFAEKIANLKDRINDPNNPIVGVGQEAWNRISDVTSELLGKDDEYGLVMNELRTRIPHFSLVELVDELETTILPKVLQGFLSGNTVDSSAYTSEKFRTFVTNFHQAMKENKLTMDSTILEIRDTSLFAAQVENEDPALIFLFQAQQVWCITDSKGAIVEGGNVRMIDKYSFTSSCEHYEYQLKLYRSLRVWWLISQTDLRKVTYVVSVGHSFADGRWAVNQMELVDSSSTI